MQVVYLTHPAFLEHRTGVWHPERPERLQAVERGAIDSGFPMETVDSPQVEEADLLRVHDPSYVESIRMFAEAGGGPIDLDTVVSSMSYEAALRSAGSGPAAVERLIATESATGVCAVRPPGHHATADHATGFCIFNNVVITARKLAGMGKRVAIVDWDAHHGNGTQDLVEADSGILYVSLHQYPLYPGGGTMEENGVGEGAGSVMNLPLPPGTAGDVYRVAFDELVSPFVGRFKPDWVLVSAGYDAHIDDPLAEMSLQAADFQYISGRIAELVPFWRVVSFLEGGYNLDALRASTSATLHGLAQTGSVQPPGVSDEGPWEALRRLLAGAPKFWDL